MEKLLIIIFVCLIGQVMAIECILAQLSNVGSFNLMENLLIIIFVCLVGQVMAIEHRLAQLSDVG